MRLPPVVSNLLTRTHPNAVVLLDIIEKTLQRAKTSRTPQQTAMHANGHHFRRAFPLFIQHIEAIFQVGIKLLGGIEPLSAYR